MNLFSGARRAGAAVAGLAVVTTLALTATSSPYAALTLGVQRPWGHASLLTNCPEGSAHEYKTIALPNGGTGHLTFCFESSPANDGRILVPFQKVGDQALMNEAYSNDVTTYTRQYVGRYEADITIVQALEKERSKAIKESWIDAIGGCAIGLAIWYAFMKIVGWIARGFMGIPGGMDRRQDAPTPTP